MNTELPHLILTGLEGSEPVALNTLQHILLSHHSILVTVLWVLWFLVFGVVIVWFIRAIASYALVGHVYGSVKRFICFLVYRKPFVVILGTSVILVMSLMIIQFPQGDKLSEEQEMHRSIMAKNLFREGEHYRGPRDADMVIVTYGDTECPWCKKMHEVLRELFAQYTGNIVWVYRHFPIGMYDKSLVEAIALECAGEFRGSEGFWFYLDELFRMTPGHNRLDPNLLLEIGHRMGIAESDFRSCIQSTRHQAKVQSDRDSGVLWGVGRVPHVIVIAPNGREYNISGFRSVEFMRGVVAQALTQRK